MTFTDLDRVAYRIGDTAFDALDALDQTRVTEIATAVERALALPPWGFRMSTSSITEFFPGGTSQRGETDLADYDVQGDMIIPLDRRVGSTTLQLTHTPVLASGLVIYEDQDGEAGQSENPFPSSTLLVAGRDYYLDAQVTGLSTSGIVHRISGRWATTPRSIKVTYKGGPRAQQDAALGEDFCDVYEEAVVACTLHNYAFWAQQRDSFKNGHSGQIDRSESFGKYSVSRGAPSGTVGGSNFAFGGAPVLLPDELLGSLTPFVNVGALLKRG